MKNEQGNMNDLSARLLDFAADCIKLSIRLSRTVPGKHIATQLLRAGSSAGANYHEACAAESRADFTHKLQLVLKELREAEFWLKLAEHSGIAGGEEINSAAAQANELARIIARSIINAR